MKTRYIILGLLLFGLLLLAGPAFTQGPGNPCVINPSGVGNPRVWDRSSLNFTSGCSGNCSQISATVCNGGSGRMLCGSRWELYYALRGNPKDGTVVASGTIPALAPRQCYTMSAAPTAGSGNYMFKAYQAVGHPGTGVLWSNSCRVSCR